MEKGSHSDGWLKIERKGKLTSFLLLSKTQSRNSLRKRPEEQPQVVKVMGTYRKKPYFRPRKRGPAGEKRHTQSFLGLTSRGRWEGKGAQKEVNTLESARKWVNG